MAQKKNKGRNFKVKDQAVLPDGLEACPGAWKSFMDAYKDFVFCFLNFLCPFAAYYLRYAVRSFFTLSRISLAEGKRAGQTVQSKIAVAVQKVKTPLLFVPLF